MTVHLDSSLPPAAALPGAAPTRQGSPLLREAQASVVAASTSTTTPAPLPTAGALVHISAQGRQSLGQAAAALQNQNILLQALGTSPQTGTAAPAVPAAVAPAPTGLMTAPPVMPAALEATPAAVAPAVPANSSPSLPAHALVQSYGGGRAQLPVLAGHFGATATATGQPTSQVGGEGVATPAIHWPSQGVGKPLYALVQTLVQQATASLGTQRVLAAQHWPAALVPVVDPQPPAKGAPNLAPLQTWLVHQGVVQTREGPRGVSITLRVPVPWLRAWEQAQATAIPSRPGNGWIGRPQLTPNAGTGAAALRPLLAVFAGPSASLQSGTVALALESPGMAGMRTSALMLLEFQPLLRSSASTQANVLYGHHASGPHLRQDPWLQMATLQASGQVRHEEDMVYASAALCDTPGCPYQGKTTCVQPFCMVLRAPAPVDALVAGSNAPGPHTPGLR